MRISDWSSDVCSSDLHSYAVAQKIGVKTIICPPAAGVASAFGLLVAPARADRSRTVRVRPASDSLQTLESAYADLEQQARDSDRESVVLGTRVSVRVDLGGRRIIKKKKRKHQK